MAGEGWLELTCMEVTYEECWVGGGEVESVCVSVLQHGL